MHKEVHQELKGEAQTILNNTKLWVPFTRHGTLYPGGSFALDLLVYGDLDLYYEPNDRNCTTKIFTDSLSKIAQETDVKTIKFERELHKRYPSVPPGIYLQLKIQVHSGRTWQVDLWTFNKDYQTTVLKEIEEIKAKLTPENRKLILKIKNHVMGSKGKTPSFCSYQIYKAVLEKKLKELNEILDYLKSQGITPFKFS